MGARLTRPKAPAVPSCAEYLDRWSRLHGDAAPTGLVGWWLRLAYRLAVPLVRLRVGPDAVTMLRLLDLIGEALGRARIRKVHVPLGAVRPVARVLHRLPGFPLTPDQLLMLEEENTCEPGPFYETFGLAPVALDTGLAAMLG